MTQNETTVQEARRMVEEATEAQSAMVRRHEAEREAAEAARRAAWALLHRAEEAEAERDRFRYIVIEKDSGAPASRRWRVMTGGFSGRRLLSAHGTVEEARAAQAAAEAEVAR